jgi:hypothetical protein
MLVLEAVCLYQLKNRDGALGAFRKAYEAAESNELLAPFIEMGNDMRTLTRAAMRDKEAAYRESGLRRSTANPPLTPNA